MLPHNFPENNLSREVVALLGDKITAENIQLVGKIIELPTDGNLTLLQSVFTLSFQQFQSLSFARDYDLTLHVREEQSRIDSQRTEASKAYRKALSEFSTEPTKCLKLTRSALSAGIEMANQELFCREITQLLGLVCSTIRERKGLIPGQVAREYGFSAPSLRTLEESGYRRSFDPPQGIRVFLTDLFGTNQHQQFALSYLKDKLSKHPELLARTSSIFSQAQLRLFAELRTIGIDTTLETSN